jgi:putative FmdB family regulatory protein
MKGLINHAFCPASEFIMPLYEYRCAHCGHQREFLQKRDAAAPTCPSCGAAPMHKLLSAAGFQLKGNAPACGAGNGRPPCQTAGFCPGSMA